MLSPLIQIDKPVALQMNIDVIWLKLVIHTLKMSMHLCPWSGMDLVLVGILPGSFAVHFHLTRVIIAAKRQWLTPEKNDIIFNIFGYIKRVIAASCHGGDMLWIFQWQRRNVTRCGVCACVHKDATHSNTHTHTAHTTSLPAWTSQSNVFSKGHCLPMFKHIPNLFSGG